MDSIGVIFDMDGVIVDNHIYHRKSWREFASRHGKTITDEEYNEKMNGRTVTEVTQVVFGEELPAEQVKAYSNEKEAMYRDLYRDHLEALPGLEDFLILLREHNIPAAVATSAPTDNVIFTLDGLGFRKYFKSILDETAVTKGKPHPEIYLKSAMALGLPASRCVVFEDALAGIASARNAGAAVVGVATTHKAEELSHADHVVPDFRRLTVDFIKNIVEAHAARTGNGRETL